MTVIPINLSTEDELSEAVLRRLLEHVGHGFSIGSAYGRSGNGYLRKTIDGWNRAAKGIPFVVLTDLDTEVCPSELIKSWLPNGKHPNLLLRVAVTEVESWLIADTINFAQYIRTHRKWMPPDPDGLIDAKRELIELAKKSSSSSIRQRLVPRLNSTATQGRDHNGCLSSFVNSSWDIESARTRSPSLERTVARFEVFKPTW